MAKCGQSVNCTDLYTPIPIEVLSDIVGIGVLSSFSITASATFFAVMYGYFHDFLPGRYLSWTDRTFLQSFDKWRRCKSCHQRSQTLAVGAKSVTIPACQHTDPAIDAQRRKGLQAFLLSLSDQVLVTGLAMICAALVQHCRLSNYEFQVVNSLAWLSSITHVTTLIVLRQYFIENKVVRNIRVFAILINLGLLMYSSIIAQLSYDFDATASVRCTMDQSTELLGPALADLGNGLLPTLLFLVIYYTHAVSHLFPTEKGIIYRVFEHIACKSELVQNSTEEEFEQWYIAVVEQSPKRPGSVMRREQNWLRASNFQKLEPSTSSRIRQYFSIFIALYGDYQESFLVEIPDILFNASYGITGVIYTHFGQIVPLLLLLLPILAATEIYFELQREKQSSLHSRRSSSKWAARFRLKSKQPAPFSQPTASTISPQDSDTQILLTNRLSQSAAVASLSDERSEVQDQTAESNISDPISHVHEAQNMAQTQQVTLNPEILEMYSRTDIQRYLRFIFWIEAMFYTSFGIVIWIEPFYLILWMMLASWGLALKITAHGMFYLQVFQKLRKLDASNIRPAAGTRAPTSSAVELVTMHGAIPANAGDTSPSIISGARSESPEPTPEAQDIVDADGSAHGFQAPRRRQTFDNREDVDPLGRHPSRSDTEANIGFRHASTR